MFLLVETNQALFEYENPNNPIHEFPDGVQMSNLFPLQQFSAGTFGFAQRGNPQNRWIEIILGTWFFDQVAYASITNKLSSLSQNGLGAQFLKMAEKGQGLSLFWAF